MKNNENVDDWELSADLQHSQIKSKQKQRIKIEMKK